MLCDGATPLAASRSTITSAIVETRSKRRSSRRLHAKHGTAQPAAGQEAEREGGVDLEILDMQPGLGAGEPGRQQRPGALASAGATAKTSSGRQAIASTRATGRLLTANEARCSSLVAPRGRGGT